MRYVRDFRIPIEICLTSNVQTRAVASYGEHPLRQYYDEAIVLSLNTDNRLMSGTTVTDVAFRWGFGHPGRFAAAFKKRYGMTPAQAARR